MIKKSDLIHLCKVSKLCKEHALPMLYRTVSITIGADFDKKLARMLTPDNTGLQHTQEVIVHADRTYFTNRELAHQWLAVVSNHLSAHKLKLYRWDVPHALLDSLSSELWQRQHKLQVLDIIPIHEKDGWSGSDAASDTDVDLYAELDKIVFPDLRALRAVVSNVESTSLASVALQRNHITKLEVDARLWTGGDAQEVEDSSTDRSDDDPTRQIDDPLTSNLFGHLSQAKPGHLPIDQSLTTLTIKDVNLTLCKDTWLTRFRVAQLKHLSLEHCKGADIFLMKVAPGATNPSLKSFTLVHDLGGDADQTVHAIEEPLHVPRNKIENLQLCLRNAPRLPSSISIRNHGNTLRRLLLDISCKSDHSATSSQASQGGWGSSSPPPPSVAKTTQLAYDAEDLELIVKACPKLLELSIALPTVSLEYDSFETCGDFKISIDHIVEKNLQLATLCILNWPVQYKHGRNSKYYAGKNLQLAPLASDVFKRHRSFDTGTGTFIKEQRKCKLEIVVFGVNETGPDAPPKPAYFVQSKNIVLNQLRLEATGASLGELQCEDLETTVLEYEARDFNASSRRKLGADWGRHDGGDEGGWGRPGGW